MQFWQTDRSFLAQNCEEISKIFRLFQTSVLFPNIFLHIEGIFNDLAGLFRRKTEAVQ